MIINSSREGSLATLAALVNARTADVFLVELANLKDENPKAAGRLCSRFPSLIPIPLEPSLSERSHMSSVALRQMREARTELNKEFLPYWKREVHQAWNQPTVLAREVSLLGMIHEYLSNTWRAEVEDLGTLVEAVAADKASIAYLQPNYAKLDELAQEMKAKLDIPGVRPVRKGAEQVPQSGPASQTTSADSSKSAEEVTDPFVLVLLRALHIADRLRVCPNGGCPAPYFIAKRRSQKYCSEACALPAQREFKRAWWTEHGAQWRVKRRTDIRKRK